MLIFLRSQNLNFDVWRKKMLIELHKNSHKMCKRCKKKNCKSDSSAYFHRIGPLGRFGLVVAMSVPD